MLGILYPVSPLPPAPPSQGILLLFVLSVYKSVMHFSGKACADFKTLEEIDRALAKI